MNVSKKIEDVPDIECGKVFVKHLDKYCYDNAVSESFFHTIKTELIYRTKYRTREETRISIFKYIEIFYYRKRLHSAIGYRSPVEFEKLT